MIAHNEPGGADALTPEIIGEALAETPGADDWECTVLREQEAQLYLIGPRVESRRVVHNERARVVIYNDHAPNSPSGDAEAGATVRGATALSLLPSDLRSGIHLEARLRDAVTMASLTDNPPFALPGTPTGGFPSVRISDPALQGDMTAALDAARLRLEAAVGRHPNLRLSSAEFYAARGETSLLNSRGLSGSYSGTHVALDVVLIYHAGNIAAETHFELERRRLEDLQIEETVAAYAAFARDSVRATTPRTHHGPVILSGAALSEMFNGQLSGFFGPVAFHASARAAFQKVSRFTPGEPITGVAPHGDRLTIWSDALRPYGIRTAPFDEDGLPARRVPLVEDGILRGYWADARYAGYLGIEPTGALAGFTIERGPWSLEQLRAASGGPVYEVVAFSWMNPDTVSGDFVAEIKLGYRHDASGTTPIKGGSLSGNVFAALADARLSDRAYSDGLYFGPAAIRFEVLTIAGE